MQRTRYLILLAVIVSLTILYLNFSGVISTALYWDRSEKRQFSTRPFDSLPYCEYSMTGPKPVTVNKTVPILKELEQRFTMLQNGGHYRPTGCQAAHSTAIIVPHRNRVEHLKLFLQHMHPFLQAQRLEYTIYVAEMEEPLVWRKGALLNAAFIEALSLGDHDCVVLHDVDMLPMDAMISYSCVKDVIKHPTVYLSQFNFTRVVGYYNDMKLGYFGGVLIFQPDIYRKINGFSNIYAGWGGEDDDMLRRVLAMKIPVEEPESDKMRYQCWVHSRQPELMNRAVLVETAVARMEKDGLTSVEYDVIQVDKNPLYTRLYLSVNQTQSRFYVFRPQEEVAVQGGWDKVKVKY